MISNSTIPMSKTEPYVSETNNVFSIGSATRVSARVAFFVSYIDSIEYIALTASRIEKRFVY